MGILHPTTASSILLAALVGQDGSSCATAFTAAPALFQKAYNHRTGVSLHESSSPTKKKSPFHFDLDPSQTSNSGGFDHSNTPPSLQTILTHLAELKSGSDLRGTYLPHKNYGGTIANVSRLIKQLKEETGGIALTPLAAHCYGAAFARWLLRQPQQVVTAGDALTICIGRDPRVGGDRLADAFARGAESVDEGNRPVKVVNTNVATTPSMFEFVRGGKCDASVMVTASHLPVERNGMKFFSKNGGLTKDKIDELIPLAKEEANHWFEMGILPPTSGNSGIMCSEVVDFMPYYQDVLKQHIITEVESTSPESLTKPLSGLNIVVNPGNGAGCFFNDLLRDLGANVAGSIHLTPDGTFPDFGVPNPEKKAMVEATMQACEAHNADIGIMFDTDADRSGFILPRNLDKDGVRSGYESLNGNRLIALISAIYSSSSPGCTIVTDSTTSERLNKFLEGNLGLNHYRFVRGYANVIGKAKELTEGGQANAEVAIEISGHCALKENGYTDDGTYTAVKMIGLLARTAAAGKGSLLDLISDFDEMPFEEEVRIQITDGSLKTTTSVFQSLAQSLVEGSDDNDDWTFDEDNFEGARFRLSSGGHFMIRQSLHDPVISMQVESASREEAREKVADPLLSLLSKSEAPMDYSAVENL